MFEVLRTRLDMVRNQDIKRKWLERGGRRERNGQDRQLKWFGHVSRIQSYQGYRGFDFHIIGFEDTISFFFNT